MKHFLLTWISTAIALLLTAKVVPGFSVTTFVAALTGAIAIGLVNAIVRPIIVLLSLPVNLLTFGLFIFVINALTLLLASALTPVPGFVIHGFLPAFFGSIVLSIISSIITYFLRPLER